MSPQRIAITSGEPAGIGPDICIAIATLDWPCELVFFADPTLIEARAKLLNIDINISISDLDSAPQAHIGGTFNLIPIQLKEPVLAGKLSINNAPYVVNMLKQAAACCLDKSCAALVTAPVQKSIVNEAGIPFSGHTEFFAERCGGYPVMMLATSKLRVALATTHLPLKEVSEAITPDLLNDVICILNNDLKQHFGIQQPRIAICGLNPHAGESGHLGDEEINVIQPVINDLRKTGIHLSDPLPADTAFTPHVLEQYDVVLAMYHDQGLPVLKSMGFGEAVNITLGLPIVRTSVDHGTALDLAGTGKADANSLKTALLMALHLAP